MTRIDASSLQASIRRLQDGLDTQLVQAATMAADLIVNEARRTGLFRDRTGRLRKSIMRGPVTGSVSDGTLSVDIRAGGLGGVSYARHVHDGTRPHIISARNRKALRFAGANGFAFFKYVSHPGTAPRPFLDEAAEAQKDAVARIIGSAVRSAFVRAGFRMDAT